VSVQSFGAAQPKGENVMSQFAYRGNLVRIAAGAALAGLLSVPGIALGQSLKEQIVGTWQQASIYNEEGDVK
jgi:hypothetical protein